MPVGGQPGNSNAAKSKAFHDVMRKACLAEDFTRVHKGIQKVLDAVADGEEWALLLVRDTLDGKPKQQTEITGEDGGPITIERIAIQLIAAKNDPQP